MRGAYRGRPRPPRGACRGSALTESIVLMAAMLPLMFAIPMVGKLVDLNQTAVQAGRYATWEATVHGGEGGSDAPAQVAGRFFGVGDEPILSGGVAPGTNALWGDGAARASLWDTRTAVEIDGASVETLRYGAVEGASMPIASGVGGAIGRVGEALAFGDGASWDLGSTALTRSGVRVKVRGNGWFDGALFGCGGAFACLEEAGTILTDGWSAKDDDRVKERVRTLVPARVLDRVGDHLAKLGKVPFLEELKPLDDAFGHVGDFVPPNAERDADTYGLPRYVEDR